MIFLIADSLSKVGKIGSSNFVALNIWERQHIEEWIRTTPEILGEPLLIVSIEFDRFDKSNDRLDVLAIDRKGNLVVVEIKRDCYAGYADLQAIRYAAMVSAMTIEKLLPYYISYLRKYHTDSNLTEEKAYTQLIEFVDSENFEELSNRPRIILCSEDFSQEITTTVFWLRKAEIDISCVKITPYQVEGKTIIVPKIIIPLEEAEQYLIDIQKKEERQQNRRQVRPRTMRLLLENGIMKSGDKIYLKNGLPEYMGYDQDDPTYHATITGKLGQSNSVRWEKDGKEYSISFLTWKTFKDLHPDGEDPGGVNGNWHWVNEEEKSLWELAEEFLSSQH